MDFYTSPITAEVDGVDIRLKVSSKQERDQRKGKRGKGTAVGDVVPTAADLAQDFLETQPVAEKKELEEALAAETQDLVASVAISESESDDDSTLGTGQGLSLPAFLTNFLQGIVDRIQIRVQGVAFQVDVEVPVDPASPASELVTFQLSLDHINVEGVTTPGQSSEDGAPAIVHKEGKRHVLLENIRAALITEANVFSSLVRTSSMPSSVSSRSPAPAETTPFPPLGLSQSLGSSPMSGSDELAQSQYALQDSEAAFNIPYDFGDSDELSQPGEQASPMSTPRASLYRGSPPRPVSDLAQSTILGPGPTTWSELARETRSEPFPRPSQGFGLSSAPSPADSVHSVLTDNSSGGAPLDDLAQSHIYSHEEAESMYMSAFSQTESVRLRNEMPGAWDGPENADGQDVAGPSTAGAVSTVAAEQPSPEQPQFDRFTIPEQPISQDHEREAPASPREPEPAVQEPEPAQDDIPTPRGPTRLVKEILSLNQISLYLPSIQHQQIPVDNPDLGKSIAPHIPGAFSVYSSSTSSPKLMPVSEPVTEPLPVDPSIEVILNPVEVRFDASIGFLLAMVVARLLEATQGEPTETVGSTTASKPSSKTPDIKVTVEKLSMLFLNQLAGVADIPQRMFERRSTDFSSDVLLQAQLVDLRGSLSSEGAQTEANFSIEKFRFGYSNDDIISFDRSVMMFESVANTFPSAGQDVSLKATMGPDVSRLEINTLPLHVKLDLQRLDETFSWFGGLSSFLNMGASMNSNASKGKSPAKPAQKPRGVRFDAPIHPDDKTASKENKTDLRVNGLRVDVIGKDCSAMLNTSALKLVSREEGIGIHFSKIRLAGPYFKNSKAEAPVVVEVLDTRAEYLALPRPKDLERLLELITPSKIKFDADEDEIMVDTLLRQRRKGPVLSLAVGKVRVDAGCLQQLNCLPGLADDLAKLGTVAKYLPEDDRPGLMTLCHVKNVECRVDVGGRFGALQTTLANVEVAHISLPELVAVTLGEIWVTRNKIEEVVVTAPTGAAQKSPVLMMRLIDDIEPVLRVNLMGLGLEYRVPTIMDVLDLADDATPEDFEIGLAASVANLGEQAHTAIKRAPSGLLAEVDRAKPPSKPIKVDVAFRDCLVGLNPLRLPSKLTLVLTDAHLEMTPGSKDELTVVTNLKRAAVLLVDDVAILDSAEVFVATRRPQAIPSPQITDLCAKGYVNICQISAARATVMASRDVESGNMQLEVEVRDDLLVMETCADSTQTLIALANALTPPTPPSKEIKYRTTVVPVEDLLASIRAEAFGQAEGDYDFDNDFAIAQELGGDGDSDVDFDPGPNDSPLNLDSQYYEEAAVQEELFDATSSSMLAQGTKVEETNDGVLLSTTGLETGSQHSGLESSSDDLSIKDDYFARSELAQGTAHRWNSKENRYDQHGPLKHARSPLKVCVREVHVIWHLFDGYDWARTREVIAKAVMEVEAMALEQRARTERRRGFDPDYQDEETIIGDCLFNSIYIGIPANRDPKELSQAITAGLHDYADTESIATTAVTTTTLRPGASHRRTKSKSSLKLSRSRRHKITFELKGMNADFVMFPPGSGETVSSIDVRVHELDIFDHMPESTWKKFATYDMDAGEREMGASMVHLELINTRPVDMPATELVVSVSVLPLRLHVDQDALDFIIRFFTFRDESEPAHVSPSDVPFIQRIVVNSIPVRLDFKPKRVDYAGLRSGKTTEFMNFMILDNSRLVLRRIILYGVSGFDRLGEELNDIWTADVKSTQLPGVLAGLAPVRSLVSAGSGFRDLIEIPIREYRKDGRIVRSLKKGATAFAKTTGTEVVKLGAKLAIGTQYALQGAEGLLVPGSGPGGTPGEGEGSAAALAAVLGDDWDEEEYEEERARRVSLYADQPLGIVQGVRGAYASLARDLSVARDAIIAVPAEVMESASAKGAAKAVLRKAPTIILRPAIGASKAIGQTLLGATNSLDPLQRRRVEAVCLSHVFSPPPPPLLFLIFLLLPLSPHMHLFIQV